MKIGLIGNGKMNKEFLNTYKNSIIMDESMTYKVDIIVDFSHPNNLEKILNYCKNHNIGLVIGTTGYSIKQEDLIKEASNFIPIFITSNFSLGINIINKILDYFKDYDISILEMHQKTKIDIPSGTAKMFDNNHKIKNIFAIRGGDIIGCHELILIKDYEKITINHTSFSRKTYILGAIRACEKIINLKRGLYHEL